MTVSGADLPPALYEMPCGTTLGELASAHGVPAFAAALPAGMFGGIVGPDAAGRGLGSSGVVRFMAPGECPVALVAEALRFLGAESARQCGICIMGTKSLDDTLAALAAGSCSDEEIDKLAGRAAKLPGRGACGLLDAAASMAGSLLATFPGVVRDHIQRPRPDCRVPPSLSVAPELCLAILEGTT